MERTNPGENYGNLKISENVIETIAKLAALEVEGVVSICETPSGIKGLIALAQQPKRGISIDLSDEIATINISVNVKMGVNVPKVSEKLQENIKSSVQNMTSITVSKVNVYIADVEFENKIEEELD